MTAWPLALVAALTAQGMSGIPVGGQDGDLAAINRVALGTQTVSVWKNAKDLGKVAGEAANALAAGTDATAIAGVAKFSGGKKGVEMNAILLAPTPITKANINVAMMPAYHQGTGLRWRRRRCGSGLLS